MTGQPLGPQHGPTRRGLLLGSGLLASTMATSVAAGCDLLSGQPARRAANASHRSGSQAPDLARRARAGDLEPLHRRLPDEPVVVRPGERAGRYGGRWRTVLLGPADTAWLDQLFLEPLLRWDDRAVRVLPNVAKRVEANTDGSEYTLTLRPGMHWSDGSPFTADDIVFAQNDVFNDPDLTPEQADNRVTARKVNGHVVRLTLEQPDSLYLQIGLGSGLVDKPSRYLKRFHKKYNPDIQSLVDSAKVDRWVDLFYQKADVWHNTELPSLKAWTVVEPLGEGTRVVVRRNPYYWKVDPDGRQLPYIDEVVFDVTDDVQVMLLKALQGQIDMHFRHFNTPPNKPVLARDRKQGNYRFFDTQPAIMNGALVVLNLTHEDAVKREIFNNRDFRIGLSYAINRDELNDAVYQRQGEPWQAAPRPESKFFDKEFAKQYTEFDPDRANQHLDRAGYGERDDQGLRLGPDGSPIQFTIEIAAGSKAAPSDTAQLLRGYWRKVGLDVRVNPVDRALLAVRNDTNKDDAILWEGDGGMNPLVVPDWYFPDPAYLTFGRLWSQWYDTDGKDGEEPPPPIKRQMELYDQVKATADVAEQTELMRQILQISKEQLWVIGTVLAPPSYGIAKNNFRNVPKTILDPGQIYFQIDSGQCFFE